MVVAYHGCDVSIAERLLQGDSFTPSRNDYDWLGGGIYFWEFGADRALHFAREQVKRGKVRTPVHVGALIHLGNCFDLLDTRFTQELVMAYESWARGLEAQGVPIPRNEGRTPEHKLRRLDCAALNWFLDFAEHEEGRRYDTVRCGFSEGKPVYPGSGIFEQTHIQLAVRNPNCILGVFRPIPEET
ncbi:hypothetical protein [Vitiosangium sp. GDMCC 1.1324]|uniref:hypothetical protein n=1 Tax=Vitiosangium sp. (strain GDMCC 1.1324) TaxID=2138576 RepID=UPI000D4645BC|nr:hypothetical protein [Vitiosangium sp. GDMCC 1.1324]PTL75814.1 hypothetical protein DAT35_53195 [Vitiosangium sp. GDMCC 1.1324]